MRPLFFSVALLWACTEKPPAAESLKTLSPKPLPSLGPVLEVDGGIDERDALHRVEDAPVYGEKVTPQWLKVKVEGSGHVDVGEARLHPERAEDAGLLKQRFADVDVLLTFDEEVYLAQLSALFSLLEASGARVHLLHPKGQVAFPVTLRDEVSFQQWLDEAAPGKVRVIQRADGLELTTNMGKLLGVDVNGPSVPNRGGQIDVATARRGLSKLSDRFTQTEDLCFVPSFGTELVKVATAMSANYQAMGEPFFERVYLVFARLKASDAGK